MGYNIEMKCVSPFGTMTVPDGVFWHVEEEKKMERQTVYKVNEIFETIQGEGFFTGEPVIFVRLSGCSMGCEFCDTKYSQEIHYNLTAEQILRQLENFTKKRVVISGGEPFEQDLAQLLCALNRENYDISIETNGAHPIIKSYGTWVTVSPKKQFLSESLKSASEIKFVISNEEDIVRAKKMMSHYKKDYFYLQPESGKEEATKLCVKTCLEDPRFKLSVQVHKLIDIK